MLLQDGLIHGAGGFAAAVMEGVAFQLRILLETMGAADVERAILFGGGAKVLSGANWLRTRRALRYRSRLQKRRPAPVRRGLLRRPAANLFHLSVVKGSIALRSGRRNAMSGISGIGR